MRRLLPTLVLAACVGDPPAPGERPSAAEPPAAKADPVLARARAALARGDLAVAKAGLRRDRWLSRDRASATLLLAGCLLAEGDYAAAIDVLRADLAKTTGLETPADRIAVRLLRHHASGGGKRAASAREAAYFGLYALKALKEDETARADLDWAARAAPEAERALVRIVGP